MSILRTILALSLFSSAAVANAGALPVAEISAGAFALDAYRQATNVDFIHIDDQLAAARHLFEGSRAFDSHVASFKGSGNYGAIKSRLYVVSSKQSGTKAELLGGGVWKVSFLSDVRYASASDGLAQCLQVEMRIQQRGGEGSNDFGVLNSIATDAQGSCPS